MSHSTVDYAALIRASGHRMTPQRQVILDAVCAAGPHCTVDAVYELVHQKAPAIDRSTVYRTLDFLSEIGLIVCSSLEDHTQVYEIAAGYPSHHHLVCTRCHADLELGAEGLSAVWEALEKRWGFRVEMHHLILYGVCKNCKDAEE